MRPELLDATLRFSFGLFNKKEEIDYAIEIDNLVAGQNLFRMNVKKHPTLPQ